MMVENRECRSLELSANQSKTSGVGPIIIESPPGISPKHIHDVMAPQQAVDLSPSTQASLSLRNRSRDAFNLTVWS